MVAVTFARVDSLSTMTIAILALRRHHISMRKSVIHAHSFSSNMTVSVTNVRKESTITLKTIEPATNVHKTSTSSMVSVQCVPLVSSTMKRNATPVLNIKDISMIKIAINVLKVRTK